jgi:general stress protein 26
MKTPDTRSPELDQMCKLIEPMPIGMLTSLDHDGQLVSRPIPAAAMDDEGALWLYTDLLAARADPVRCVNLSFGNHATASYLSLSGEGRVETDRTRIAALWAPFASPWFPEGPASPRIALLKFIPRTADYWDASRGRMVRMFTTRSALITSRPSAWSAAAGSHKALSRAGPHAT